MALARTHSTRRRLPILLFLLATAAVIVALLITTTNPAQGANEVDSSTIGVGSAQAVSNEGSMSAHDRITAQSSAATAVSGQASGDISTISDVPSETIDPTQTTERSITVKDPDPVVVPVAIDYSNDKAVEKAKEVCTLDPLPTAPHVAPNVHDGTWSSGVASAYNIASNDDGKGNFGVSATASGISLSNDSITVAVPESKSYLLGSVVELCYDGKVVIATVTDTGGFAQYGRDLDLAPGVYKAFGCSNPTDWGTRTVYYRFL